MKPIDRSDESLGYRINPAILLPVLFLVGFGIRLYISWLDPYLLFQKCVVDDAYFYLGIAKNIAAGNGATFDGAVMTNGFHLIYALLLVPIFWFSTQSLDLPLHYGLTVLSGLNVLTGLFIYLTVRDLSDRLAGVFACCLWLFNPYVILISLNGVESGVAVFFLSIVIYLYQKIRTGGVVTYRNLIILAVFTALAILSRIDAVFMLVAITLTLFLVSLRAETNIVRSIIKPFTYGGATMLMLSPWFVWNIVNFGTIRQISGVTLPNIAHNMYLAQHQSYFSTNFIKYELFRMKFWIGKILLYSGGAPLFISLIILFIILNRGKLSEGMMELYTRIKRIDFAILSSVLLVSFYALYFWGWHRPWYYLSVILVVTLCLGGFVGFLSQAFFLRIHSSKQKRIVPAIIGVFLILALYFSFQGAYAWQKGLFPFQKQLYDSALWLKDNTEKTTRIGAISAGIYGYLTQRTTDLAGVVNEEAYKAMREQEIFSYLREKKIEYLVDRVDMVQFYSNRFDKRGFLDKLTPVKKFGDKDSDIVVYKVHPEKGNALL